MVGLEYFSCEVYNTFKTQMLGVAPALLTWSPQHAKHVSNYDITWIMLRLA